MISVLMQHNDRGRTGANLDEHTLTTANVNVNTFGKVASFAVKGQIYAQPLYVPFVRFAGGQVHNALFVVTMDNWAYAFDAEAIGTGSAPLWSSQVGGLPPIPARTFRAGYQDVVGNIGILGTPVIATSPGTRTQPTTQGTLYFVVHTVDAALLAQDPGRAFRHLLFALDITTGQPVALAGGQPNPVAIGGTVAGTGYRGSQREEDGKVLSEGVVSAGSDVFFEGRLGNKPLRIKDGRHEGGTDAVLFNPMQQLQRPGLLLDGGVIYIAFGSHGDHNPYHGWIFAHDAGTLEQKGVLCTTPNGAQAGVWQAGEGLVADGHGNIYLGTGNGDSRAAGATPDLGESFVRIKLQAGGLEVTGWLNAFKETAGDEDLGAASPKLLPDGRLVGGGKDGNFYLLDPAKLKLTNDPAALLQKFPASSGKESLPDFTHHIHGSPVVLETEQGPLVYVFGENDVLRVYRYDPQAHRFPAQGNEVVPIGRGTTFASGDRRTRDGMPGAMLALSAAGKPGGGVDPSTAILWASFPPYDNANKQTVLGELRAYDATRVDQQGRLTTLWSSRFNPFRDHYGSFPKFCCPTIANGRVYQATFNQPGELVVYGLLPQPGGGYHIGFGGTDGLTLNGGCRVDHGHLRLTEVPHLFVASSVFTTAPVPIASWKTVIRFRLVMAEADGFTFTIQGEGPHALGSSGGGLGYGPDPGDPRAISYRITRSVAIKFDLFDNGTGQRRSTTGLYRQGATTGGDERDARIDLRSGRVLRATISYQGTQLKVQLKDDADQGNGVEEVYQVDLAKEVGGPSAHVGFTGATGGLSARQEILGWHFET
jgi:hypothetical protein